jgi:signal transduction histidine kinase
VVREYLSFVRLPEPRFEQHDIVRVTKDLLDFLEEEMSGKGVRLKREFGDGIPLMLLDVHKMREVLINLLKNGSEAMPGGGEITTRIARQGEEVLITISDTGVGIPEDRIESIFQPFTSTKEGGTGLGLPVAQEIIAEHGGAISCASKVGEGSTFEIRLPLEMGSRPRLSPREVTDPGSPQGAGPTARCG